MTSCTYNGTTSTFTYGADGLRRRMVVGNDVTDYLLDGQNVVREIKNGQVEAFYLYGPRGPEYRRDAAGNVEWYLYDGLGSVVATVGSSGNVLDTRKYDVYGAVRSGGVGTRHRFVGQLGHTSDDETGLLYMRARYMDPVVGRFVSEDPAGDGGNWFAYCGGNPVDLADPDGRIPAVVVVGVGAVSVALLLRGVVEAVAAFMRVAERADAAKEMLAAIETWTPQDDEYGEAFREVLRKDVSAWAASASSADIATGGGGIVMSVLAIIGVRWAVTADLCKGGASGARSLFDLLQQW